MIFFRESRAHPFVVGLTGLFCGIPNEKQDFHSLTFDVVERTGAEEEEKKKSSAPGKPGRKKGKTRKLILKNSLSPGDLVMLTAAVRDLHELHPGKFITDVRTPCPALFENSPYLTPLEEEDPEVEVIECHYPLIHRSNQEPWHFIHGFASDLSGKLGVRIRPTAFKGDIHISDLEKSWISRIHEITGKDTRFWIVVAGGKTDYTIKWWSHPRFQKVIDHFRDRLEFVQVGEGRPSSSAARKRDRLTRENGSAATGAAGLPCGRRSLSGNAPDASGGGSPDASGAFEKPALRGGGRRAGTAPLGSLSPSSVPPHRWSADVLRQRRLLERPDRATGRRR